MLCSAGTATAGLVGGPLDGRSRWLDGGPALYWELAAGGPVAYGLVPGEGDVDRATYAYRGPYAAPRWTTRAAVAG
jgi:hypothetical protein